MLAIFIISTEPRLWPLVRFLSHFDQPKGQGLASIRWQIVFAKSPRKPSFSSLNAPSNLQLECHLKGSNGCAVCRDWTEQHVHSAAHCDRERPFGSFSLSGKGMWLRQCPTVLVDLLLPLGLGKIGLGEEAPCRSTVLVSRKSQIYEFVTFHKPTQVLLLVQKT